MQSGFVSTAFGKAQARHDLLQVCQREQILRISAQGGLSPEDALEIIERHGERVREAAFPEGRFDLLS